MTPENRLRSRESRGTLSTMCLIVILHQVVGGVPVLVAANREESYDRQGTPPQCWTGEVSFIAGRDPNVGGTWLGANAHRVLIGITNRPAATPPAARSRGLLCRDLLASKTAESACRMAVDELSRGQYAGCNVLAIDQDRAFVVHFVGTPEVRVLEPGVHVLGREDVDQATDPRVARAFGWIPNEIASASGLTGPSSIDAWLVRLRSLCMDHGDGKSPPICVHSGDRGTISSSIIALSDVRDEQIWLHAQGPPCSNEYVDCSSILRQLGT